MCEIHMIYFSHAMSIVFFGLIDLVDADRVYVSALCARPFRQMIVEAFLFIQMRSALVAVPLDAGELLLEIIARIKGVIILRIK